MSFYPARDAGLQEESVLSQAKTKICLWDANDR